MPEYRLLITDVTRYGTLYCVAGWDIDRERMIRPEPSTANILAEASRFWGNEIAGAGQLLSVGNVVSVSATMPPTAFPYPHATEDRVVVAGSSIQLIEQLSLSHLTETVAGSVSASPSEAFGGHLVRANSGKGHVAAGTVTTSLGAIEIAPDAISFYADVTDSGRRRLRALIDHDGVEYDFSVPADAAYRRFIEGQTAALEADAKNSDLIHVRLGLCRPFAAMPNSCYAQVNGLLFL